MDDSQTLSEFAAGEIRAVMARRKITGRDLAQQLNVSRSWVSYRLTGTTEIGLNDLQRIAAALQMPVAAFLPATVDQPGSGTIHAFAQATAPAVVDHRLADRPMPTHPTPTRPNTREMPDFVPGANQRVPRPTTRTSARNRPQWLAEGAAT